MRRRLQRMAAAVLAAGMVLTAGGFQGEECLAAEASPNLIECPDFAQGEDASVWYRDRGSAVITARTGEENIYGEVTTYGKITGRKSNYECFSQDITGVVEKDKVYTYSFYAMLDPVDYADAPAEQRCVEFSPYITANGSTTYSMGCSGTVSQVLEPGVWTYFTGTYTPTWSGNLEQVVIRILEQGTDYGQGAGVMGTYYLTGMELREQGEEESVIQMDVPRLKEAVALQTEEDFIMGTSIVNADLSDGDTMALVSRHFNAVTLGNELKPDAMFGYSSTCPGTETVTLNGEKLVVPRLDFSRAEKTLDWIYDWNQSNPDDPIKVRGHVLVWHSQTPEWWFHEDYDAAKPYVDTETMNRRLEWYIKTMAEHFTGADSKYRGMFYGWDVVNEAVSDNVARYRNAAENSSWWAVYQSNEFIINAFRYANRYMDPEVELYYNDYNEWFSKKRMGIELLLKDVLAAEGTRIDGMGMQGHYQTAGSPTMEEFAKAARAYAAIVGQVQITELDMKASDSYDGTEATREAEFLKEGYRYEELFDTVKSLRDEGVNITNITVWGVVDKNSWLQTFHSVGGASDGTQKQCPLLFDDDYQVKPAYWAFVDSSRIEEPESTPKPTASPKPTATPKPAATPTATATPKPTTTPKPVGQHYATYESCRFYRDALGDTRCYDSKGNQVINGFRCDGTYTYFFQADGTAMRDRLTYHPDGEHVIYFDEAGHEVFSNFANVKKTIEGNAVDDYCFFDVYGYLYVDVVTYDQTGTQLYYANPYGVLERGGWFRFSDTVMCADGTPWAGAAGGYGYANADGTLMKDTWTYDWEGSLCYMQENGVMLK